MIAKLYLSVLINYLPSQLKTFPGTLSKITLNFVYGKPPLLVQRF